MTCFIVYDPNDPTGESYWISSDTCDGAREIVRQFFFTLRQRIAL